MPAKSSGEFEGLNDDVPLKWLETGKGADLLVMNNTQEGGFGNGQEFNDGKSTVCSREIVGKFKTTSHVTVLCSQLSRRRHHACPT